MPNLHECPEFLKESLLRIQRKSRKIHWIEERYEL